MCSLQAPFNRRLLLYANAQRVCDRTADVGGRAAPSANAGGTDRAMRAFILRGTTWANRPWHRSRGRAAGGHDNYGLTLLGSALGGTVGAGFDILGLSFRSRGAALAGFMSIPELQWVGGVIAYHMSHNAHEARRRSRRHVMPMVQVEQRGASLQLSGAF
jgi:hypothetical protein